jgi:hypothetical protein
MNKKGIESLFSIPFNVSLGFLDLAKEVRAQRGEFLFVGIRIEKPQRCGDAA